MHCYSDPVVVRGLAAETPSYYLRITLCFVRVQLTCNLQLPPPFRNAALAILAPKLLSYRMIAGRLPRALLEASLGVRHCTAPRRIAELSQEITKAINGDLTSGANARLSCFASTYSVEQLLRKTFLLIASAPLWPPSTRPPRPRMRPRRDFISINHHLTIILCALDSGTAFGMGRSCLLYNASLYIG